MSGTIDGSVQQMSAEGVTLNGGAIITGDLLVPGTPVVQLNSSPTYNGTLEGSGSMSPSNYTIMLNSGSSLRHVIRRTTAVSLSSVATVPTPTATASATVNTAGQSVTWTNLKDLTLNSNVGQYTVPAGTYGNFNASSGTGFKLGVAGTTQASVYNFQNLTLNGNSTLQVLGPVVINLANGFSANAPIGASSNPAWLTLNIKSGGFTLNSGCNLYGYLVAPSGTVIINSGTQLVGGVSSAYLTVNGNGLLKLQAQQTTNLLPVVSLTAPANGSTFTAPASFTLTANASDPDGTISKVEFFQSGTKIGQSTATPYSFNVTGLSAGSYTYFARATDNSGATADSTAISVTVNSPNQPPVVSITSPANGATFTAPATVALVASASDPDGTIAHVDFYQGSVFIGQDISAPYQLTTSTLSAGSYVFSAKAYDNANAITTSATVTITVINPNQPPTVSITAPANGSNYDDPASFSVTATAADSDGSISKVELFQNGVRLSEDLTSPYGFAISALPVGVYDFVARATDNQNSSVDSAAVRITVAHVNDAPVANAQSQSVAEETPLTVTLTGSDPDGDVLAYTIVNQPGHGTLAPGSASNIFIYTPVQNYNGSDSFTFKVSDGAVTSSAATVQLTVTPVNDAPVSYPASFVLNENTSVSFQLGATDVDSSSLIFNVISGVNHGNLSGSLPNLTYTPTADYSGSDSLVYSVSDGQLTSAPATISFTINHVNRAPVVALTAPANGAGYIAPANFVLQANASDTDGTITKVEFFQSGTKIGEATATPYNFSVSSLAVGSYSYVARATDNSGATTDSAAIAITVVANTPPIATLTAPADGSTAIAPAIVTLTANASDSDGTIARVEFYQGATLLGQSTTTPYSFSTSALAAGSYGFSAKAFDNLGASATSATATITVVNPNQPPAVTLTAPANGAQFIAPATVVITATASDSDGAIAKVEFFNGATKLGEVLTAPYQFTWNGVAAGNYTLTARATDDAGTAADSAAIAITVVVNTPPTVVLTAPADGAVFTPPASISLNATASDSDGSITKVEFFAGSTKIGEALAAPYQFVWNNVSSGTYLLTARATDNLGAATTSVPVTITVNTAPVANPQSISTAENSLLPITLTGSDIETSSASLVFTVVTQPGHGALSGNAPNVIYTPSTGYVGGDSFTFKVNDGLADSPVATIGITMTSSAPQPPHIVSQPILSIVLPSTRANQTAVNFTPIELKPSDVNSTSGSVFSTLPTTNPALFGLTGSDIRRVNFDVLPGGTPLTEGATITNQYASVGVTMNAIPVRSTIYEGPASAPFTTFTTGAGARQVFTFTVPVVAAGVINTSPDHDLFEFYSPDGTRLFSTADTAPNSEVDRFVGARVNDGNLIGSMVLVNTSGDDEMDELVFEVLNDQVLPGNYLYPVHATDPANLGLVYSLVEGPPNMVINPATGVLSWLTRGIDAGDHPVTVRVTNTAGLSDTQSFVLRVILNAVPQITAGPDLSLSAYTDTLKLRGIATDDGVPAPGNLTLKWSTMSSGTGQVLFDNPAVAQPFATFSQPGIYLLRLDATDGLESVSDWMEARVGLFYSATLPMDPAAWWPGNGLPIEVVHGNHDVTFGGGVNYGDGKVALGFAFNGSSSGSVPAHADMNLGTSAAGLTIETWVKLDEFRDVPLVQWSNGSSDGVSLRAWINGKGLYAFLTDTSGGNHPISVDNVFSTNVWSHVAVTYDKVSGMARLYCNGELINEQNLGIFTPQTSYPLLFGALPREGRYLKGTLDEITLYKRPLTLAEVRAIFSAGALGKIPRGDNTPPVVNAGPDVQLLSASEVATLTGSVVDDGKPEAGPRSVVWSKVYGPGTVIFAGTNTAATTASFSAPGTYILRLDANDGEIQAVGDTMVVRVGVTGSVPVASGIAAWWPANAEIHEVVNGNHDVEFLPRGPAFGPGEQAQGFAFDGSNYYGRMPAHADLDLGTSAAGLTIETWVKLDEFRDVPLVQWSNGSNDGVSLRAWINGKGLYAFLTDTSGGNHPISVDNVFSTNVWSHVAVTYERVSGVARLYFNGELVSEKNVGVFTPQTSYPLLFGALPRESRYLKGSLDEITFYKRPLTLAEVQAIYRAGTSGKSSQITNTPPGVNAGPDVQMLNAGGSATLAGNVVDDGMPSAGSLNVGWSKVVGPGAVNFAAANAPATTATFSAPGTYILRLDANDGELQAVGDTMVVRVGVTGSAPAGAGIAAWWPANAEVHEVVNGNHDVEFLPRGPVFGPGEQAQGFMFNGSDHYGRVPAHADLDLGTSAAGLTIETWVKLDEFRDVPLVQWSNGSNDGVSLRAWINGKGLYAFLTDTLGGNHPISVDNVFSTNVWSHVAVTYDRVSGAARLYFNGELVSEKNLGVFTPQTSYPLLFGALPRESRYIKGTLDEVTFYKRPLTMAEVQTIYRAGAAGKASINNTPPIVNAGPDLQLPAASGSAALAGSVVDDAKPNGGLLSVGWSRVEGPGSVDFAAINAAATTATFSAPGTYILRLDANDGELQAIGDTVVVRVGVTGSVPSAEGIAAWWPANAEIHEVVNGNHDVEFLPRGPAFGLGEQAQGFVFNGSDHYGRVPAHADLDLGTSAAGLTIETWVKIDQFRDVPLVQWSNGSNDGISLRTWINGKGLYAFLTDTSGGNHPIGVQDVFSTNSWSHVAVTYDKVSGMARLYYNGLQIGAQNLGVFTPQTSYPLQFGALPREARYFKGMLDEITLYKRPLRSDEILAIYNAGPSGKGPSNTAPVVNAGPDLSTGAGIPLSITGSATDDGLPNPPASISYQWSKISGPGAVAFSNSTSVATTVTFDTAGTYILRLSGSDSLLTATDETTVIVGTAPAVILTNPANNAIIPVNTALTLAATATDADGTITKLEFYDGATKLGEDATAPYSLLVSAGLTVGSHTLTAKATDNSGLVTTSAAVIVTSAAANPQAPTISIFEPLPGPTVKTNSYFEIAATATDTDGTIAKVEFFQDGVKLGQQTLPELGHPTTYFWPMSGGLPAGTYAFSAKATDNSGLTTMSVPVSVQVTDTPISTASVYIETPDDSARISAPVTVRGLIAPPALTSWSLQYRLRPPGDDTSTATDPWLNAATGTSPVGTAATSSAVAVTGMIGTFDPTRLLNGLYEIRVVATTSTGSITTTPIDYIVEGNMKVGIFTLAFEDLKVPVAGIPISATRTYDSRDSRVGDFGPGWRLAIANIRVQKNRNLGAAWWQTDYPGSNPPPLYPFFLEPVNERIVTVVMPDGESHRFRGGADVRNAGSRIGDPENVSLSVASRTGKYRFYPLGDTTSKLEPLDSSNQLAETFYNDVYGTQDLTTEDPRLGDPGEIFNPTRFRLTTKDGTVFILDQTLGLLQMNDLTGNTLVLNRDAQNRVTSVVSTQAAPSGNIVTSITVHRDATGRVDYIRDPAGKDLDYTYDVSGRLETFVDRENNTTQFKYENASFPYYLTKIIDPRGVTALRSEFDENGRMVKQIDADGKETIFTHAVDVSSRYEKVKDRLGHESTFYYDDRGNVTTKIDQLGAQTTFSYYPDSDWVKFETDHYGNTKSMAYDARGNVTVQTTGASLTEDPANPTTGYTTRMVYNALSAPTQITDPSGRVQSFTYDPATNNLLSNTVGVGGSAPATTTYHYNTDGTLDTVTDALGNVTSNSYNYSFTSASYPGAVKQVTVTVTDPAGSLGSDSANASATILSTSRTIYDAQQNMLAQIATRTLPEGGTEDIVTKYLYDSENRLEATIMPDGKVSETRYTSFGQTDKSILWKSTADNQLGTESLARVTSYGYDNRGNQTSTTYPDGSSESSHFDLENRRDWSQDKLGRRTSFQYDDAGRLRFTIEPDATPADLTDNPYTETVYDLTGRVTDTYDELRHRSTVVYYPDGTLEAGRRKQSVQVLSTGNLTTSYSYDASGNVRFVTDPRGNTTETRYDEQGRPTTVLYPATDEHPASQSSTKYNVLGQRIETVDMEGKVARYRYDGLGRLFEVRQYLDSATATADASFALPSTHSSLLATRYSFDELGHQTSQTDARGNATNYRYDSLGRRTKRILPDNATESIQYDAWGNLWKRTDFKGYTTTFLYDTLNRLTQKDADPSHPSLIYSHAPDKITYGYDAAGNRTDATVEKGSTVLYVEDTPIDERGRRQFKDTPYGKLTYGYYANGQLKSVASSNTDGVKLGYRYDDANRLAYVDDTSGTNSQLRTTNYSYNQNGSLQTVTTANGITHTYTYDTLNRLRTLNVAKGVTALHSYEYKLRVSGHHQQVIEGAKTITYTYDDLYRLTNETVAGDTHGNSGAIGYTLDKVGNRLSRTSQLSTLNSQPSLTYNSRDWLSGDTYDTNGNTLTSPLTAYGSPLTIPDVYDFEDHLIIRHKPDGATVNLAYDADGLLRQKTILSAASLLVSATGYLIDGSNPTGYAQILEERINTTAGVTVKTYAYGSDLISVGRVIPNAPSATISYYSYDGLGSVRELTNESGTITDAYDYDAFGNLVYRAGTTDNDYLYRGERYESDIGQYYLRARFYNQNTGRFWNQDSYEGSASDPASLHKYLYANADPVGHMDPSGNISLIEFVGVNIAIGTLSGMAIGGIANGAQGAIDGAITGAYAGLVAGFGIYGIGAAISAGAGVSTGAGLFYAGTAANAVGFGFSAYSFISAQTPRQKLAALFAMGLSVAGQAYSMSVISGKGTVVNQNPNTTAGELSVARFLADRNAVDIVLKTPVGGRGAGTADMTITARDGSTGSVDIKHLFNSNLSTIVSTITHAQTPDTIIIVKPGQLSASDLARLPGRVFSPNAPGSANSITVLEEINGGYNVLLQSQRN